MADAPASHEDVLRDLSTADEWSPELHRALLTRPFSSRPSAKGKERLLDADRVQAGDLLIKILPHFPSKTLAVLVLPLSTLAPLYEGLSLRTLQRRTKSNPPLSSSNDDFTQAFTLSSLSSSSQGASAGGESDEFTEIVDALELAVRGTSDADTETWLDCDIGRSEASLTLHLKRGQWKLSVDFDLSSLDRDEGPTVVRDHLLAPLAGLALQAVQGSPAELEGTPASRMSSLLLSRLVDGDVAGSHFHHYSQRLHGIQAPPPPPGAFSATASGSSGSSAQPPVNQREPSTPSHRSPAKKARTSGPIPGDGSTTNPVLQRHSPSGDSDGESDDSGELVLYHATPTSHPSSRSRSSRNNDPSSSSSRWGEDRTRDREAVAEAQADPQRATPTPSTRPDSQSQSQHVLGMSQGRDLEAEMGLLPRNTEGAESATSGTETDSEGEGEADVTITGAAPTTRRTEAQPSTTATKRTETQAQPPPTFESVTPSSSSAPDVPPSSLPTSSPQSKAKDGDFDSDSEMEPPSSPVTTTAAPKDNASNSASTTAATPAAAARKGKGAQNYSRGLAKRKRI